MQKHSAINHKNAPVQYHLLLPRFSIITLVQLGKNDFICDDIERYCEQRHIFMEIYRVGAV